MSTVTEGTPPATEVTSAAPEATSPATLVALADVEASKTSSASKKAAGIFRRRDAETVSRPAQWALLVGCTLTALLTAGVIYGYAALKAIMLSEGEYKELCDGHLEGGENGQPASCEQQSLRLDIMFTTSSVVNSAAALLTGFLNDHIGPRLTLMLASATLLTGILLFGFSDSQSFDAFIPAMAIIGLGSSFSFLPLLHMSKAFPTRDGLIMSILSCAFDASALLFALFQLLSRYAGVQLNVMIFAYAAVPITMFFFFGSLMPDVAFGASKLRRLGSSQSGMLAMKRGELRLQPFAKQARSREFILLLVFLSTYMLRSNFYIQSVGDHLRIMAGDDQSQHDTYITTFSLLLPFGGVVAAPGVGWLLDHCSFVTTFTIIILCSIAFSVLSMIPVLPLQYFTFVVFSLVRPLIYAAAADYASRKFGFINFGKIYGTATTFAALVNSLQYLFSYVSLVALGGNFIVVDSILLALLFVGILLPVHEWRNEKRKAKIRSNLTEEELDFEKEMDKI